MNNQICIIAEKPSVAREIARIVGATERAESYLKGNGYYVTWAFGHLVMPASARAGYGIKGFHRDNLPIIPPVFTLVPRQVKGEKGYKPDNGVVAQIKIIARLFRESDKIIVATDAGREGELIFRYLYEYIGCATPFDRLWISSLTDKAIREGLEKPEIRCVSTTNRIMQPRHAVKRTGSWALTPRKPSPLPPDVVHIRSDGCRHLHWR
ncbi:MAG: toprim domain-containing protein [Bacteroides uniformis]